MDLRKKVKDCKDKEKILNLKSKQCIDPKNAVKRAGVTIDKRRGVAGTKEELDVYILTFKKASSPSKKASAKKASSPSKEDALKGCTKKDAACPANKVCKADTGRCVNESAVTRAMSTLTTKSGQVIHGEPVELKRLQKILGGSLKASSKAKSPAKPKASSSAKKASSKKTTEKKEDDSTESTES